ncbi:MAG: tRNA pseudouridine(38-40) synthase TruA [Arachnia sp.]
MRWRIDLAYDGTDFHGWAAQPGQRTVEATLAAALATVARVPEPHLVVAGRTDAGVHARGQVCHVDLDLAGEAGHGLVRPLRGILPPDIALRGLSPAPDGFDARFSAIWRRYAYRLIEADAPADPLTRSWVTPVRRSVDEEAINQVAPELVGLRDFAAFCKRRDGATTIRDLRELRARRGADGVVEIHLLADAFCHSMVRSVVGALLEVAVGRADAAWLAGVRDSRARQSGVPVMPARGLTLEEVGYPPDDMLAARARQARDRRTLEQA